MSNRVGTEANAVGVNATDGERVLRAQGRLERLELALADEKARNEPRPERIVELEESISDHVANLEFMARKIRRQQRA